MKQEARANYAAMSREHVTEEDIETFMHVQELAAQVRNLMVIHLNVNCNSTLQ